MAIIDGLRFANRSYIYSAECDYHISWSSLCLLAYFQTHTIELTRTKEAVEVLHSSGAEMLIHCGDLAIPEIVEICSALPFYFVFWEP